MILNKLSYISHQRGTILLYILWIVLILNLVLLSQLKRVQFAIRETRTNEVNSDLRNAAHSAMRLILAGMEVDYISQQENADDENPPYDAYSDSWGWINVRKQIDEDFQRQFPNIQLDADIEDESGKINIADMSDDALYKLFVILGYGEMDAQEMVDKAAVVVSEYQGTGADDERQIEINDVFFLAKLPEFRDFLTEEDINFNGKLDSNENDGAKNYPWDNRDGKLQVELRRFATYDSNQNEGQINPNMAPFERLVTIPGISSSIADEIIAIRNGSDGTAGTADDIIFQKNDDMKQLRSISRFNQFEFNRFSPYLRFTTDRFCVRISAVDTVYYQRYRIQAIVARDKDNGVVITSWIEDNGS